MDPLTVETARLSCAHATTSKAGPVACAVTAWADGAMSAVLCDGSASWGRGAAAARLAAISIARAIGVRGDGRDVVDAVLAASRFARAEFTVAGEDTPGFSVLIVQVAGPTIDVAWVGDVHALLVRDAGIAERNEPHSLAMDYVRAGACTWASFAGTCAGAVVRPLPGDPAWERASLLDRRRWDLRAGDRLLCGSSALPGALRPDEAVAALGDAGARDGAGRVVERARARGVMLAVAVIAAG